jgi:hypothetical protein
MSYMAILKLVPSGRNIAVFGPTPQICGQRLFDQLLSWDGEENRPVNEQTCRLFEVVQAAPHMETRVEMFGARKSNALRLLREGIAG